MLDTDEKTLDERVTDLEHGMKSAQKQLERLTESLMGGITILCLPLPTNTRLEIGFNLIKGLPDDILKLIIKRYIIEGKKSELRFDDLLNPMIRILSFERLWKLLDHETLRTTYGEWELNKWNEMEKNHPCEG